LRRLRFRISISADVGGLDRRKTVFGFVWSSRGVLLDGKVHRGGGLVWKGLIKKSLLLHRRRGFTAAAAEGERTEEEAWFPSPTGLSCDISTGLVQPNPDFFFTTQGPGEQHAR